MALAAVVIEEVVVVVFERVVAARGRPEGNTAPRIA